MLPYQPNGAFALGVSPYPKRSRCPEFVNEVQTPLLLLNYFLVPQLHTHLALCAREPCLCISSWCLVLLEARLLGWPEVWIVAIVHKTARKERSIVGAIIRKLTRDLFRHGAVARTRMLAKEYPLIDFEVA